MMSDKTALNWFVRAARELGYDWPLRSIIIAMAQSKAETSYSSWGITPNPHNYGALKSGKKPPCPPGMFERFDVRPSCFFRYANELVGIKTFLKLIEKNAGDLLRKPDMTFIEYAERQLAKGYYEIPAKEYADGLEFRFKEISNNLNIVYEESSTWPYWVSFVSGIAFLIARAVNRRGYV